MQNRFFNSEENKNTGTNAKIKPDGLLSIVATYDKVGELGQLFSGLKLIFSNQDQLKAFREKIYDMKNEVTDKPHLDYYPCFSKEFCGYEYKNNILDVRIPTWHPFYREAEQNPFDLGNLKLKILNEYVELAGIHFIAFDLDEGTTNDSEVIQKMFKRILQKMNEEEKKEESQPHFTIQ